MLLDLDGKRAIVTGAATGIGRAIVRMLAQNGVRTALADLDIDRARKVAEEIGRRAQAYEVDVRSGSSVEAAFRRIEEDFGGYDILCANAGVSSMAPVETPHRGGVGLQFRRQCPRRLPDQSARHPHFLASGRKG
jgi:NAD(P)-dependent dehydrogenase (short-subunit alcohol dehydrogenase family)